MNTRILMAVVGAAGMIAGGAVAQESSVRVVKGQLYGQGSAAAPVPEAAGGATIEVSAPSLGGAPMTTGASVLVPGGVTKQMPLDGGGLFYRFTALADTPALLGAAYPAGSYVVTVSSGLLGSIVETAELGADAYPPAPQVSNYAAAQSVDWEQDFVVSLAPLAGASGEDVLVFRVLEAGGELLTDTLTGEDTAWTIGAETLESGKTYELRIRYGRYATTSGMLFPVDTGFFSETRLSLVTKGGTGVDTTPPALVYSSPTNGATGVVGSMPIMFGFSEAMEAGKVSIQWSAGLDPAKFSYTWQGGQLLQCTYAGGLPGGLHTWTLNPAPGGANDFQDAAGNKLPTVTGAFTVVGGSGGCEGETPVESAGFSLFKQLSYEQGPTGEPGLMIPHGALFMGSYGEFDVSAGQGVAVTIEYPAAPALPPHTVKSFESFPGGMSFLMEAFEDQGQLDAAYPNVEYEVQLRDLSQPPASQVTNSVVLVFGASAYPPTPRWANWGEAQAVNPTNDFTLRWDAFTGAGAMDFISLEIIEEGGGVVFSAPDACAGVRLANTATSIVVPGGTLAAGKTYRGRLSFLRLTDEGKVLAGKTGVAGVAKTTETTLKTVGGTPVVAPRFLSVQALAGGEVELTVEVTVGRPFVLLGGGSPALIGTPLVTTNPPASPLKLRLPAGASYEFYRGRTDP